MFEIEINGHKKKAEISFKTAVLYEAEFSKDIIQDFFGVVSDENNSALGFETVKNDSGEEVEVVARIDFTKIDWLATIRVLWAAMKTADPNTKPFDAWSSKIDGVDMMGIRIAVAEAMNDCFFRSEAPKEEA